MYIDNTVKQQLLSNTTLLKFAAACSATLIPCGLATGTIVGTIPAAIEAGALCWLTPLLTRDEVAEKITQNLKQTPITSTLAMPPPRTILEALPPALSYTALTASAARYLEARRAAALLQKIHQAPRLLGRLASTSYLEEIVDAYWEAQTRGIPSQLREALKPHRLTLVEKLAPQDFRLLTQLTQNLPQEALQGKTLENIREALNNAAEALQDKGRAEFYRALLNNDTIKNLLGNNIDPQEIAQNPQKYLEELQPKQTSPTGETVAEEAAQRAQQTTRAAGEAGEAGEKGLRNRLRKLLKRIKPAKTGAGEEEEGKSTKEELLKGATCTIGAYLAGTFAALAKTGRKIHIPALAMQIQNTKILLQAPTLTLTIG